MSYKVLAFDFGASSGRAMLGEYRDGRLSVTEIHRFSNDPVLLRDVMCWDFLRLMHEIQQGIIKARAAGGFDAIGIDTWGVDFGLIDAQGELLCNPVHYRDRRTEQIPEQLFEHISKQQLYRRTGIQFMHFNTIYQLYYLAQHRPKLLAACDKILLIPDLMAYFLTGQLRAEQTVASTTNLLDPVQRQWDYELVKIIGIRREQLPEIIRPCERYGMLSDELCEQLSVPPVPVIAVCTHDTASAVLSAPIQGAAAYISCGTWSLFGTELDAPLINDATERANFTNEGGYNGTTRLLKNIMGLWLIQESRRQWQREGNDYSFAELERLANEAAPFRCFIDPDAPEFVSAGNLPRRIRAFCERTGQYQPQTPGEVARCINQSLAMKYKYTLSQLQQLCGQRFSQINMLGGGVQSSLLCSMTANATGVSVLAGPIEATAIGNIAVQLIALGAIPDAAAARQLIADSDECRRYTPQSTDEWDAHYSEFLRINGTAER